MYSINISHVLDEKQPQNQAQDLRRYADVKQHTNMKSTSLYTGKYNKMLQSDGSETSYRPLKASDTFLG